MLRDAGRPLTGLVVLGMLLQSAPAYAEDKNNRWVTVTPLKDGEVRVIAKGVPFAVQFRQGHTMGTYSSFADNARSRGIVP